MLDNFDVRFKKILKKQELRILRNLDWIALTTICLFLIGYARNSAYYACLGIPTFCIDIGTTDTLLSAGHMFGLIAPFIIFFIIGKYDFVYIAKKKNYLAKQLNINSSIDFLFKYGNKSNIVNPEQTNLTILFSNLIKIVIQHPDFKKTLTPQVILQENISSFPDLAPKQIEDFIKYGANIYIEQKNEKYDIIKTSIGITPFTPINRFLSILMITVSIISLLIIGIAIYKMCFTPAWGLFISIIGASLGGFVAKKSNATNRKEYWLAWLIVVIIVICCSFSSGILAACSEKKNLPTVTITTTDGNTYKGGLLAAFKNQYVIKIVNNNSKNTQLIINTNNIKTAEIE